MRARDARGGQAALFGEAHGGEARAEGGREIFVAEGEREIGVPAHGGHHAQFGIGQGVKAIHPDGVDAVQPVRGDLCGGEFQTAGAHGEAAAGQFAVDFLVDGEEGVAERDIGKTGGEAGAIAAGGGEFVDGVRQRIAEAVEAGDAGKLGARDALRGLFHQEVKHGGGDLGGARRHSRGRSAERVWMRLAGNTKPSRARRFCRCCAMVAVGTRRRMLDRPARSAWRKRSRM